MAATRSDVDAKLAAAVRKMRAFFAQSPMPSISVLQQTSLRDRPYSQSLWLSHATVPCPEDSIRDLLLHVIDSTSGDGRNIFKPPGIQALDLEWIGHRKTDSTKINDPPLSEKDKYFCLMQEVTSDVTILYVHGGGF